MYINEERSENALLVAVDTGEYDAQASMNELYELTASAGATAVGAMIQKRASMESGTCVGSGFLEEICNQCQALDIDLLIFDHELTPTQIRNIEEATNVRTIDRTMLILDIFALRAHTKEGALQVELAQLKYLLPRLSGKGIALSRLGGGIGTRGPGETKLETDRRHIRRRIENIKKGLKMLKNTESLFPTEEKKTALFRLRLLDIQTLAKAHL